MDTRIKGMPQRYSEPGPFLEDRDLGCSARQRSGRVRRQLAPAAAVADASAGKLAG
jgi:hypothetical protein